MLKKLFVFFLISYTIPVHAQTWQDTVLVIDNIMNRYKNENPGAQLAISRHGKVIYSFARGMADLEHAASLTKLSKIEAGSVSKQFTAACVLLLEQQGKLSLNDDVRKYIPEVPNYGFTITLRHLMTHTSGLKDWGSIADVAGWPRGTKTYNNDDALQIISRQKTLNNKPGDEYIYSNTNYTLLTIIVNRVSGTTLPDFSKKYIFDPAGMKHTEWRDNYKKVVKDRAMAYSKSGAEFYTNMPNEYVYGHGGLLTTAEDMLAWNHFYLGGKLGSPSLLSQQLFTSGFNNGKINTYAAGLNLDSVNGHRSISHSGATASYRANLEHFPDKALSIAWLSNTSDNAFLDIPSAVRNIFVKPSTKTPETVTQDKLATVNDFARYLGAYRENVTGSGFKIYKKDSSIFSSAHGGPLKAKSKDVVAVGRGQIKFLSAEPNKLLLITPAGDTTFYARADSAQVDEKALQEYAGEYHSEEAESTVRISIKNGNIFVKLRGNEAPIIPVYKDGFTFPGGDIYFERDKKGKISKFFISVSRARKIEFAKVKN